MKKMKKHILIIGIILLGLVSCRENIDIKPVEGEQLIGVYGSITDELKKHSITLSRTMQFYEEGEPEMVSDASIFVHDGFDTIWYEETEDKGIYQTMTEFAGVSGHTYHLSVDLPEYEGGGHYFAQSTMLPNIETIDSIVIKQYKIANVIFNNVLGLYPYFQSLNDDDIYYMVKVAVNDSIAGGEKITNCGIYNLGGMSGWYVNGELMAKLAGEIPVWSFADEGGSSDTLEILHHGDTVRLDLSVISSGYANYVSDISSSNGSNPMLGIPSNVCTNICPEGRAVGYFYTAATKNKTIIY